MDQVLGPDLQEVHVQAHALQLGQVHDLQFVQAHDLQLWSCKLLATCQVEVHDLQMPDSFSLRFYLLTSLVHPYSH